VGAAAADRSITDPSSKATTGAQNCERGNISNVAICNGDALSGGGEEEEEEEELIVVVGAGLLEVRRAGEAGADGRDVVGLAAVVAVAVLPTLCCTAAHAVGESDQTARAAPKPGLVLSWL
jgi:hypothetical protein